MKLLSPETGSVLALVAECPAVFFETSDGGRKLKNLVFGLKSKDRKEARSIIAAMKRVYACKAIPSSWRPEHTEIARALFRWAKANRTTNT